MKYVAAILIGFCFTTIAQGWNIESLPHEKEFVTPADAFYSSDDGELFVLVGDAIYLDSEVQVFDWDNQVGWWMPDRTILSGELYFAHSCQMFDSPIYGECLLISDSMNHRVILASPDNGKILWSTGDYGLDLLYPNEAQGRDDGERILISDSWNGRIVEVVVETGVMSWEFTHNYRNIHDIDYFQDEGISCIGSDDEFLYVVDWTGDETANIDITEFFWPRAFILVDLDQEHIRLTDVNGCYETKEGQILDGYEPSYSDFSGYNFSYFKGIGIYPTGGGVLFLDGNYEELGYLKISPPNANLSGKIFSVEDVLEIERVRSMGYFK